VALANSEHTRCHACQREVAIPEAHRRALALCTEAVAADAQARRTFASLGSPPGLAMRIFGAAPLLLTLVLPLSLGTFLERKLDALEGLVCGWVERHHQTNAYDWLTTTELSMVRWGSFLFIALVLTVTAVLGRRRFVRREGLVAALHARPAERDGGPSRCRTCGAPLTVPANTLGVRCAYCSTDNLVAIPVAWLERAQRSVTALTREATSALGEQRAASRDLRWALLLHLGAVALFALLFEGCLSHFDEDVSARAALASPRVLLGHRDRWELGGPVPVPPSVPLDNCRGRRSVPPESLSCGAGGCTIGWFVALRAGERLSVATDEDVSMRVRRHVGRGAFLYTSSYPEAWGPLVASSTGGRDAPLSVEAPMTAWYHLDLTLREEEADGANLAQRPLALCAEAR
jgi:hypothetical protein